MHCVEELQPMPYSADDEDAVVSVENALPFHLDARPVDATPDWKPTATQLDAVVHATPDIWLVLDGGV
jgi:hypothetical protein